LIKKCFLRFGIKNNYFGYIEHFLFCGIFLLFLLLFITAKLVTKAWTSHRQATTSSRQTIENQHFRAESV